MTDANMDESGTLRGYQWKLLNVDMDKSLFTKLLENRNLRTEEEIEQFLSPDPEVDFHDPFLMEDMAKAVARIDVALRNRERIVVFGDYDVDGISGSAILIRVLRRLGAEVSYRLPHRVNDGYGLQEKFVRELAGKDVKVLITVDNGISCAREISLAKELGIDVIVTDHHTVPAQMPEDAFAILHPKLPGTTYPFDGLTGSGVAFKLAKALIFSFVPEGDQQAWLMPLLDLASLGTVADLGPMKGENRLIVKYGLKMLEETRWPGLSRLKNVARISGKMSTYNIGFQIGPRINAAGRISSAYHALHLLLDDGEKSEELAQLLETLNRKRQKLGDEIYRHSLLFAQSEKNAPILILHDKSWHSGIIGIIAGRLAEKFARPVCVMEDRGETLVGSARSPEMFNIIEGLTACREYLDNFGGHACAAGFTVSKKNLAAFKKAMVSFAKKRLHGVEFTPSLSVDCEIPASAISWETMEFIHQLEPFGVGNDMPTFLIRNAEVLDVYAMGKEKQHLKGEILYEGKKFPILGFGMGEHLGALRSASGRSGQRGSGGSLSAVCEFKEDEWKGKRTLSLLIRDAVIS